MEAPREGAGQHLEEGGLAAPASILLHWGLEKQQNGTHALLVGKGLKAQAVSEFEVSLHLFLPDTSSKYVCSEPANSASLDTVGIATSFNKAVTVAIRTGQLLAVVPPPRSSRHESPATDSGAGKPSDSRLR